MINLPDVIPSIIYDDTNSYSSIFRSNGKDLDGITSKALYNVNFYNERYGEKQYVMPVLYAMSKKIALSQKEALENGAQIAIIQGIKKEDITEKYENKAIILVEDTIKAMGQIAEYKRSLYDIPVIAITRKCWKNKYKRYYCKCDV